MSDVLYYSGIGLGSILLGVLMTTWIESKGPRGRAGGRLFTVEVDPADYVREPTGSLTTRVDNLFGVPWFEAEVPPVRHECWPQTSGWMGLNQVQRCACGGIRGFGSLYWTERNSREAVDV